MPETPAQDALSVLKEITALLEQSRLSEAVNRAREALDQGNDAPLLRNLRAYWLEGQNRPQEALVDLERAAVMAPDDPAVLNALGLCLAKLGRMNQAYEAFRKCASLAPGFAPAHFNCGWALEELGELERASAAFEEAARLNPDAIDAWARLATLNARRDRADDARTQAAKALSLNPAHSSAILAMANVEFVGGERDSARRRLEALVTLPQIGEHDRAGALGLLGDVLDAEAQYREAFNSYSQSNALYEGVFKGHLPLDREMPMRDYVAWLLASFENRPPGSWSCEGLAGDPTGLPHLFVLGFPRSGTTLLEEVLACHPAVVTSGEKDALSEIVWELFGAPAKLVRLASLGKTDLVPFCEHYWQALQNFGISVENRIVVDKQPFNTIRLPLIAKLFPDARILFCLRDPRDVVLSCFRTRFALNAANAEFLTLESTARLYDAVMRLAEIYRRLLSISIFVHRHEDLVADFEGHMRRLCQFVGIEWVEAFRDFAQRSRQRDVATPSAVRIQRGLGRDSIGHWRNYREQLKPVLPILEPWVEKFGYPKD